MKHGKAFLKFARRLGPLCKLWEYPEGPEFHKVVWSWSTNYCSNGPLMAQYAIYCARVRAAAAAAQGILPPRRMAFVPASVRESSRGWFRIAHVMVAPVRIFAPCHCLLVQCLAPGRDEGVVAAARLCAPAAALVSWYLGTWKGSREVLRNKWSPVHEGPQLRCRVLLFRRPRPALFFLFCTSDGSPRFRQARWVLQALALGGGEAMGGLPPMG